MAKIKEKEPVKSKKEQLLAIENKRKEVEAKAEELSKKLEIKIHPLLFMPEGEEIVGFMKEPNREFKKICIDLFYKGQTTEAGSLILEAMLIKEESDERILSEKPEHDYIYLGALMEAIGIVKYIANAIKKN